MYICTQLTKFPGIQPNMVEVLDINLLKFTKTLLVKISVSHVFYEMFLGVSVSVKYRYNLLWIHQ